MDATAIVASRRRAREAGARRSVVAHVVHAAAGVLREHPEANAAIHGRLDPTVATYDTVSAKVTRDTLAHLTGVPADTVYDHLRDWALTDDELRSLDLPFATVSALRDEIVPPSDAERLRRHVADLDVLEHDDVHGAPAHLAETKAWSLLAVQRMRPDADPAVTERLTAAVAAARGAGTVR
ncbi:hypothetical protein [Streptomyces sp. bgisy095]|uniref:hypothetical protein n=1 Tax=unclassified Streptomyces TaxID=2593676 RepID=UPI003D7637C6